VNERVLDLLREQFGDVGVETSSFRGDDTVVVRPARLREVCRGLRDREDLSFDQPIDLTCVDYLRHPEPRPHGVRFVLVYHLRSMKQGHRLRLKVPLADGDLQVASVADLWRGFTWFEREVYDMFGVRFAGHPDLRRLLTHPEFTGHPLLKDYPVRKYQPITPMPTLPVSGTRVED